MWTGEGQRNRTAGGLIAALGFGCFHFGPTGGSPTQFSGSDYVAAVRTMLEGTTGVRDIAIDVEDDFEALQIEVDEPARLQEGENYAPYLEFGEISFVVHIPFETQNELCGYNAGFSTGTEDFRVVVRPGWAMPVTMVDSLGASNSSDPSVAVQLVRKFLVAECAAQPNGLAEFQFPGPSPFHANFFLVPVDAHRLGPTSRSFVEAEHRREGYDRFLFRYDEARYPTTTAAADAFFDSVLSELDLFYRIEHDEIRLRRGWARISAEVDELVAMQGQPGIRATTRRLFGASRKMHDAFVALARFEANALETTGYVEIQFRQTYAAGSDTYIRARLEEQLAERHDFPTEQTARLLELFEQRRLTDRELSVAVLAAVVGGAVGAGITAALG